jgi:hypothetical protein
MRKLRGPRASLVVNTDSEHPHISMVSLLALQVLLDLTGLLPGYALRPLFCFIMTKHYHKKTSKLHSLLSRLALFSGVL